MKKVYWVAILSSLLASGCELKEAAECQDGEKRCLNDESMQICSDNSWYDRADECAKENKVCRETGENHAECVFECEEGATQCDNNALKTCVDRHWQSESCEEKQMVCSVVDHVASCAYLCEEGRKQCSGKNLLECVGHAWNYVETCDGTCISFGNVEDDKAQCYTGNVEDIQEFVQNDEIVCSESWRLCLDDVLFGCDASNMVSKLEDCKNGGKTCAKDGDDTFSCVRCTAGETRCDEATLQTCGENGIFEETRVCPYLCGLDGNNIFVCIEDTAENNPTNCSDGKDNDGDGLTDCADDGCKSFAICQENSFTTCSDGVDNDGDTLIDCKDDGCTGFDHCSYCGDGKLAASESCDGNLFSGGKTTCALWNPEKYKGGTVSCTDTCEINYELCEYCGDGKVNNGEICDGSVATEVTCESLLGYGAKGTVHCSSACTYDTTGCSGAEKCGNGELDLGEQCDPSVKSGSQFSDGNATCEEFNANLYSGGDLSCHDNCTRNTDACVKRCGNGKLDGGETCDPGIAYSCLDSHGATASGSYTCQSDCSGFVDQCIWCGDGKVNGSEACDTTSFKNNVSTCAAYHSKYHSGALSCNSACQVVTSDCNYCGDGKVNGTEGCDSGTFRTGSSLCEKWDGPLTYTSGSMICVDDCHVNDSTCVSKNECKTHEECWKLADGDNSYFCNEGLCQHSEAQIEVKFDAGDDDEASCPVYARVKWSDPSSEKCDFAIQVSPWGIPQTSTLCEGYASLEFACGSGYLVGDPAIAYIYGSSLPADIAPFSCTSSDYDSERCAKCGDGIVNGDELCDTDQFKTGSNLCAKWDSPLNYHDGTLICNADCTVNESLCSSSYECETNLNCNEINNDELDFCNERTCYHAEKHVFVDHMRSQGDEACPGVMTVKWSDSNAAKECDFFIQYYEDNVDEQYKGCEGGAEIIVKDLCDAGTILPGDGVDLYFYGKSIPETITAY